MSTQGNKYHALTIGALLNSSNTPTGYKISGPILIDRLKMNPQNFDKGNGHIVLFVFCLFSYSILASSNNFRRFNMMLCYCRLSSAPGLTTDALNFTH